MKAMPIDQNGWGELEPYCDGTFASMYGGASAVTAPTPSAGHFIPTSEQAEFIKKWGHMDQMVHGEFMRDLLAAFTPTPKEKTTK